MDSVVKFTHSKAVAKIENGSPLATKVDQHMVAQAFGGTAVGRTAGLDTISLRDAITAMLASTGGRPSIAGTTAQVKIPRIEEDWLILEKIAKAAQNLPHKPSVTQAAALVLHLALSRFSTEDVEAELARAFSDGPVGLQIDDA